MLQYTVMKDDSRLYKTYGGRRSLRLRDFDYRTPYIYHVTWATAGRRPVLAACSLTVRLIGILKEEATNTGVRLYAYCFMPDHVHLLLCPEAGSDLIRFVQAYKSKATRVYWKQNGRGRIWQRGFYDHILRCEEDVREVFRYILENPVRKGLVKNLTDFPFSGSCVFEKQAL